MGRVIKVKMNHSKREQALIAQRKQRTMFLRILLAFCVVVVVVAATSIGPVWLVADATRMSQVSATLKQEIADELTVNQKLLIDDAVAKASDDLVSTAKIDLGMVEPPAETIRISIDEPNVAVMREERMEATFWGRAARLTMGEASALLVGDVGISALR